MSDFRPLVVSNNGLPTNLLDTDNIVLELAPTANNHGANKAYVDSGDSNLQGQIDQITGGSLDGKYVERAGDDMTGTLTFGTDKILLDATTGYATFADYVTINGDLTARDIAGRKGDYSSRIQIGEYENTAESGVELYPSGEVWSRAKSTVSPGYNVYRLTYGTNVTIEFNANGDAVFDGTVTAGKFLGDGSELSGLDLTLEDVTNNGNTTGNVASFGGLTVAGTLGAMNLSSNGSVFEFTRNGNNHIKAVGGTSSTLFLTSGNVFGVRTGPDEAEAWRSKADQTTEFQNDVKINGDIQSETLKVTGVAEFDGGIISSRPDNAQTVFLGQHSGANKIVLYASGDASFEADISCDNVVATGGGTFGSTVNATNVFVNDTAIRLYGNGAITGGSLTVTGDIEGNIDCGEY